MSNQTFFDLLMQGFGLVAAVFLACVALIWILGALGFIIEPLWQAWESRVAYKRQQKLMIQAMHRQDHNLTVEHIEALEKELWGDNT